jgi:hypothetical protein
VIIDGVYYDGISESGFIEKGTGVIVVRFENAQVYVETGEMCLNPHSGVRKIFTDKDYN